MCDLPDGGGGGYESKKKVCVPKLGLSIVALYSKKNNWFWVGGWFGLGGWVRQIDPPLAKQNPSIDPRTHTHTQVLTPWINANTGICTAPPKCRVKYADCTTATYGSPSLIVHRARRCGWPIPLATGGLQVCGEGGVPTVRAPGRHVVPNAPAGGALPSAMDAAPGAAGSGVVGCVPNGLLPPGRARGTVPAAHSTLAAPAGVARPASGRKRGRGPRGTATAGGLVSATPSPALCRQRAAGCRALLPAGTRRSPHGRGASAAGVAAARTPGRGRLHGVVPGRAGFAKRAQMPPLAISLTSARAARRSPQPPPPPQVSQGGGGHSQDIKSHQPSLIVRLRIARELGMDDGVLRALAAMYRQLQRAFRLAGALGAWWQATNGILQGCPLSVILINLLTTAQCGRWRLTP